MSDPQEIMARLRAEKEKTKGKKAPPPPSAEDLAVRLLVAPYRRHQLIMWLCLSFCFFLSLLAADLNIDKPWWLTSLPIIGVGLMICLIPPTEQWEYKPWQTRARQYERHQIER